MKESVALTEPSSTADRASAEVVRFHFSLNVSNLAQSVAFYRQLFDQLPTKQYQDYAKFDVDSPPIVFSLVPHPPDHGRSLSHLGLRVPNLELLEGFRVRMEAAGICTSFQNGTVCGYARQDKLWLRDADGNFWEIYYIEEDVLPETVRQSVAGVEARVEPVEQPSVWQHYITSPVPERIPADDRSLDEVQLTGTFNANIDSLSLTRMIAEAHRVLKPGGLLTTHGLMGNHSLTGDLSLPGIAALVRQVPDYNEVIDRLRSADFVNLEITKLDAKPWFHVDNVALREVKIQGYRRPTDASSVERTVLYRGPFNRLRTDDGLIFRRGERQQVTAEVWNTLRQGHSADSFVFFEPGMTGCSAS